MVYIRFSALIASLLVLLLIAGCTATSTTPARVEDRTTRAQQAEPSERAVPRSVTPAEAEKTGPADMDQPRLKAPVERMNKQEEIKRDHQTGPAVVALLDNAQQFSDHGENQRAIASVERALRIEPKNPLLWNKLGNLHLKQGNWVQAIAVAKKSNVLASGDFDLQADNWQIIARARQELGDEAGANEASKKAEQAGQ